MVLDLNLQQPQLDNNLYLLEKRYETLLDINNKKLLKEINELRDSIKRFEGEVENLKLSQKSLAQKTIYQSIEQKPNADAKQANNSKDDIKPEDVSIEKYFYYGKK